MFSIAKRPDRHFGLDTWQAQLNEVPLVAIVVTPAGGNPDFPWMGQWWPSGQSVAQYTNSVFDTTEIWPNNVYYQPNP